MGIGDNVVDVEGTAARIATDTPETGSQTGILHPLSVADRPERYQHYVSLDHTPVGKAGTPHVPVAVEGRHPDASS